MVKKHLLLFDIDGTLTKPVNPIEQPMIDCLNRAKKYFDLGIVGGSDRAKQIHQLGESVKLFDFAFSENGTVAFDKDLKTFHKNSIAKHWGEEKLKRVINFILHYVADIDVPVKRGTFIEYRNGLINAANKLKYWDQYRDLYRATTQAPPGQFPQQFLDALAVGRDVATGTVIVLTPNICGV